MADGNKYYKPPKTKPFGADTQPNSLSPPLTFNRTLLLECEHDIQNFHNREKAGLPPHDPQCVSLPKAGVTGTKKRGRKGFDGDLEA